PGEVDITHNLTVPLRGRDVILVEGIVDTGRTITRVIEQIKQEAPASIEVAALLDKPGSHRSRLAIKYRGFAIKNEFIIGYGMDNTQKYRNLPYIGRMIDS
ncbi:MAG: hypoxanthine phosphoribosyltransferase, partial [Candidatus Zixiibacteriota bacterium]